MNTADWLLNGDEHSVAIVSATGRHSYAELNAVAAKLLGKLRENQIGPGDRVGILGENSVFWVSSYLAILKLGAIAVPLPGALTVDDLRRRQQVAGCKAVFLDERLLGRFSAAFAQSTALISSDILNDSTAGEWPIQVEPFDVDQDAALMLTSGTTAIPRAVRITHRNIQANTVSIIRSVNITPADRMLVVIPFNYCFGTSLLHTHLRAGASLSLCNSFAYPETALDIFEATGCTAVAGVPSTFQTLLRNSSLRTRRLTSLTKVQQAGGKLQPALLRELISIFPSASIYTMYGQTEATARLSCLPPAYLHEKLGSIGRGIPGVTLEVLNESGRPVQPGEIGEIVATGENISPGYLDDAEGTAERFDGRRLKTGDLATVDEDGFIYVVDRKSDFIKCLGHRISSHEVESAVMECTPEVVSAAAVGRPDPVLGEAIAVFVTLARGATVGPADILRQCRRTMTRHMVPKDVMVVDTLPLNASGKVVKAVLRQRLAAVSAGSALSAAVPACS